MLGAPRNVNPAWAKARLVIGLTNNLLLYQLTFNYNSPQTRQFLHDKMLKKKNWQAKMRIQQIIEFKLRGPGALSHYMYSYNWLFSWPTAQHFRRQCTILPPTWAKSHTKFNP